MNDLTVDVFTTVVTEMANKDNIYNPDKFFSKTIIGESFGQPCVLKVAYTAGSGYIEGHIGLVQIIAFFGSNSGWQVYQIRKSVWNEMLEEHGSSVSETVSSLNYPKVFHSAPSGLAKLINCVMDMVEYSIKP